MPCKVCHDMLHGHKGRKDSGSQLQLTFRHHVKAKNLRESAEKIGCYLCRVTQERLETLKLDIGNEKDTGTFLVASLKPSRRRKNTGVYHLDFRIEKRDILVSSFVLKPSNTESSANIHARPISDTTSDPKVIQLAKDWITECTTTHEKCRASSDKSWHPNRLLYLGSMLQAGRATETIRLVSTKKGEIRPDQPKAEDPYVTLSHRWGAAPFFKLTNKTLKKFLDGLPLKDLPQTFQDAVKVTCELDKKWLWIDALCIKQDKDDLTDWLEESTMMEMVYANSFCNISATAAWDSSYGLFNSRDRNWKWVETVNLNTKDLRDGPQDYVDCIILDLYFWDKYVDNAPANRRSWVYQERILSPRVLHWCQDQIAFECRDQSRAECRPAGLPHLRIKSGVLIDGVRLKSVDLGAGKQLRAIREASSLGKSTNSKVLRSIVDEVDPKFHFYELWKHWVEVYTKMELTKSRDRLIALSGIARMMSSTLEFHKLNDRYIAGMWENYMASQLLWFVNEGTGEDRQPLANTRPEEYRAPTFSWASVETPRGITFASTRDSKDPALLIQVEVMRLSYRTDADLFGLLTDGYLVLRGVLRKIELTDSMAPNPRVPSRREAFIRSVPWNMLVQGFLGLSIAPIIIAIQLHGFKSLAQIWKLLTVWLMCCGSFSLLCLILAAYTHQPLIDSENVSREDENRYSWRLVQGSRPIGKNYQIVYLDSPASEPSIFGPHAQVYCLPALREDRYLTCLLVQATDGDYGMRYRRIGLTRVSSLTKDLIHSLTMPPGNNETTLGRYYFGPDRRLQGESTICIV